MRKNIGLTLIELLVATLIGTLTFLVLFYVSFTIQENITISKGVLGITETGRLAVSYIANDIRQAKLLTNYGSYSTNDATLVLQIPVTDVNGAITGYDVIIYVIDLTDPANLKLDRIINAAAGSPRVSGSRIIAENIDTLLFSSYGTGLSSVPDLGAVKFVTVKVITKAAILGVNRLNEIITSASLRNKKISY